MKAYEGAAEQVEKMVGDFLRGTFGPDAFLDTLDGLVVCARRCARAGEGDSCRDFARRADEARHSLDTRRATP